METGKLNYHIFLDFDGTVTLEDVGYNFFKVFAKGRAEDIVRKYRSGEINAVNCLKSECDIYNEYPAPVAQVKEFIGSQKLTPGLREFIEFCRFKNFKITIISAGFDFYIEPILYKHGFSDIEVLSNHTIIKNGRIHPEFIYYDENTCFECANCKGARIKELTADDEISVFIGDGHSDHHGAEAADIVFAKSFLASYLDKANVDYIRFDDFFEVMKALENIPLKIE
jgi:2-hydroxy-3-keto-5-methylthiopentenyl-1-phosphate phosphatase